MLQTIQTCVAEARKETFVTNEMHGFLFILDNWCKHVASLNHWNIVRKSFFVSERYTYIRMRQIAIYWLEISQRRHHQEGGIMRRRDRNAFEYEFQL